MRARQVVSHRAWHAAIAEHLSDVVGPWQRRAIELAQHHFAVGDVMNKARFEPIETDETKTAQDLRDRKQPRELRLVAKAVLKSQNSRALSHQRRQEFRELIVRSRLQPDNNQVARPDFLRRQRATGVNIEVSLRAADMDSLFADDLVVGAQQEMHILSRARKASPVVAAHRAATDHRDFQEKRHPESVRVPSWGR